MIHFPPVAICEQCPQKLSLLRQEKIGLAARENGVDLILCGHIHEKAEFENRTILCAGSACAFSEHSGPRNWIHFVEVEVSDGRTAVVDINDLTFVGEGYGKFR